jgi:hypothetical protein
MIKLLSSVAVMLCIKLMISIKSAGDMCNGGSPPLVESLARPFLAIFE